MTSMANYNDSAFRQVCIPRESMQLLLIAYDCRSLGFVNSEAEIAEFRIIFRFDALREDLYRFVELKVFTIDFDVA